MRGEWISRREATDILAVRPTTVGAWETQGLLQEQLLSAPALVSDHWGLGWAGLVPPSAEKAAHPHPGCGRARGESRVRVPARRSGHPELVMISRPQVVLPAALVDLYTACGVCTRDAPQDAVVQGASAWDSSSGTRGNGGAQNCRGGTETATFAVLWFTCVLQRPRRLPSRSWTMVASRAVWRGLSHFARRAEVPLPRASAGTRVGGAAAPWAAQACAAWRARHSAARAGFAHIRPPLGAIATATAGWGAAYKVPHYTPRSVAKGLP